MSRAAPAAAAAAGPALESPRLPVLPALVVGELTHHRFRPVRRSFRHGGYLWLVDLDDLPRPVWWQRPFTGFGSVDHVGDPRCSIKGNVERLLAANGTPLGAGGRILMLANARVLGHVFDPLSVFWCYDGTNRLVCVVAEVHNTYGQRHAYLLAPSPGGVLRADKELHVSPFFDLSGYYRLRFELTPASVRVSVSLHQHGALAFHASFRGRPQPASTGGLLRLLVRYPLVTQRVSYLIRLHGVRLWLRGLPVQPRPVPPRQKAVCR